jgi:arylsulfatase
MRMISSVGATVGYDRGSAVSARYRSPFPFGGTLNEVEVQLIARAEPDAGEAQARAEMSRQ